MRTVGYRGFDARHLHWMFTTTHMANYTPLAWLSYAFDHALWGLNPVGYHLTNILFHALNAVLFYALSRLLLRVVFPAETSRRIELGAVVAALAFAAHPLRAESVAWASERRDVLAGFFFLSTLLLYVKAAAARTPREAFRLRAGSVACFALAALSKASVVPLPAALLALDWYPLRRRRLVEKLPYAAIAAAAAGMAVKAQIATQNFTALADHGPTGRLAQVLYGSGFYVWKTVLPTGLCALYPLEHRNLLGAAALGSAAAIAAVAGSCWALGVPRRAQAALWFFYLAMLSPVLGLLQNGPQLVALRYSYLSCLGWAVLAGAAAVSAARERSRHPVRGACILGTLGLWLAANAWAVPGQIALWHDDRAVWSNVLSRYPDSSNANMNFADALLQAGDLPAAENYARAALRLAPNNTTALLVLAQSLISQNRMPEAQAVLEGGLSSEPDWADGHALLGVMLSKEGREADGLTHLLRAAALQPTNAETQANAGSLLALRGRFAEALPYFERAAKLEPAYEPQLEHVRADLTRSAPR